MPQFSPALPPASLFESQPHSGSGASLSLGICRVWSGDCRKPHGILSYPRSGSLTPRGLLGSFCRRTSREVPAQPPLPIERSTPVLPAHYQGLLILLNHAVKTSLEQPRVGTNPGQRLCKTSSTRLYSSSLNDFSGDTKKPGKSGLFKALHCAQPLRSWWAVQGSNL